MKHMHYLFYGVVTLLSTMALVGTHAPAEATQKFVTVGTAGVTGVYYPAGGAICRLMNRSRKEHGVRCSVESTGGSIDNLFNLQAGELDFGIVQSDWQYHAVKGTRVFTKEGEFKKLRSVFSLHSEPFTVLAHADAKIRTFSDLQGKRLNLGNTGSGNHATMVEVMRLKGWKNTSFALVTDYTARKQGPALCARKIDAVIYAAGHPNGGVQELTTLCHAQLIDVKGKEIDRLVRAYPFYAYATIPGRMYKHNPEDTHTFGVKATLVTTTDMDEEIVYRMVKAVFDNLDNFKTLHPVFATLDVQNMIRDGNTAPLHPGALRYYKERGWIDEGGSVLEQE